MRWSETDSNEDIDCDIADADASGEISKKEESSDIVKVDIAS